MERLTPDQTYQKMKENLLPIFKQAVLLCEYISDNPDYFKQSSNQSSLFGMALVSFYTQKINSNCKTLEDRTKALRDTNEFRNQICNSELNLSANNSYETRYQWAFKHDSQQHFHNKPLISASGDILDWAQIRESAVFKVATAKFSEQEKEIKIQEFCKLQQQNQVVDTEEKAETKNTSNKIITKRISAERH